MMEVYKTPSKETQEILLASAIYAEVIEGLNGYFASEPRNEYITIHRCIDSRTFHNGFCSEVSQQVLQHIAIEGKSPVVLTLYLYDPEKWADILISWLRTKHEIFYYPDMEAKYAKMEKIPPFTKRMMNEGALNSLKKLYKNITGEEDETSSPTLIASTISCNFSNEDKLISVLKEQNELLKDEIRNLNAELATKWTKTSLINWLQQSARHKGVELDDAFLYSDDAQYDWTDIVNFLFDEIVKMRGEIKAKESGIEDLKEHITLLEADLKKAKTEKEKFLIEVADRDEEIESLQKKGADLYLEHRRYIVNSIMNNIRQEASRNGFDLPEEIDGEPLSIERTFHDLLELLKKRTAEIKEVNDKRWKDLRDIHKMLGSDDTYDNTDDFAKAVKARAECVKIALGEKSDINALIRDWCTKNDVIAPSRYFSDKACVEYLFSVINLKQKDRSFAILQNLYRDIFKKQPDGLSAEDIANKILDKMLETEDLLHKSVDSVNKECKATGKLMVTAYKLDLKDYILKGIEEHGYRYDGLEKKSVEEIVDWIITMATSDHSFIVLKDIYTTVAAPVERLRYNDCGGPTVDHMKEYILRRFEGFRANTEYCLKRMSELDGCQKELKTKVSAKDDEISRLKDLINVMNEEVKDM